MTLRNCLGDTAEFTVHSDSLVEVSHTVGATTTARIVTQKEADHIWKSLREQGFEVHGI